MSVSVERWTRSVDTHELQSVGFTSLTKIVCVFVSVLSCTWLAVCGCRQSEAAAQQQRGLLSAALSLGMRLLVKPQAGDGLLMRKARDLLTVGLGVAVPGAALLLPLAVYRDSGAEVRGQRVCVWTAGVC
jgi:hypothetical protein